MNKTKRNVETKTMETGQTVIGQFIGESTQEVTDRETGELVPRKKLVFNNVKKNEKSDRYEVDPENGRFALWQDMGLKTAFADALVQEKEIIEITRLEQRELSGGRRMNQYDIFSYQ